MMMSRNAVLLVPQVNVRLFPSLWVNRQEQLRVQWSKVYNRKSTVINPGTWNPWTYPRNSFLLIASCGSFYPMVRRHLHYLSLFLSTLLRSDHSDLQEAKEREDRNSKNTKGKDSRKEKVKGREWMVEWWINRRLRKRKAASMECTSLKEKED